LTSTTVGRVTTSVLTLRELDDADLAEYVVRLERDYAQEMHRLGGVPLDEARESARQSVLELFPGGRPAEGNRLWFGYDEAGERVGVLWLAHRQPGTAAAHAWIYDIEVESHRRGQGWGRRLMEEAERITREWGLSSLRLNVFGDNEVARNLYRSQGFREQNVIMTKAV
jgi:ribosomal protein S18 acetylase RimI-like enzyme